MIAAQISFAKTWNLLETIKIFPVKHLNESHKALRKNKFLKWLMQSRVSSLSFLSTVKCFSSKKFVIAPLLHKEKLSQTLVTKDIIGVFCKLFLHFYNATSVEGKENISLTMRAIREATIVSISIIFHLVEFQQTFTIMRKSSCFFSLRTFVDGEKKQSR